LHLPSVCATGGFRVLVNVMNVGFRPNYISSTNGTLFFVAVVDDLSLKRAK